MPTLIIQVRHVFSVTECTAAIFSHCGFRRTVTDAMTPFAQEAALRLHHQ